MGGLKYKCKMQAGRVLLFMIDFGTEEIYQIFDWAGQTKFWTQQFFKF